LLYCKHVASPLLQDTLTCVVDLQQYHPDWIAVLQHVASPLLQDILICVVDLQQYHPDWTVNENDQLMDAKEFRSETVQRVYQALVCYDKDKHLDTVHPTRQRGSFEKCIKCLLK